MSCEAVPQSAFYDNTGQGEVAPTDHYVSPAIITTPRDVAHLALGTDPEGERDGYGAKWDDYKPPAGGVMGATAQMRGTDQIG